MLVLARKAGQRIVIPLSTGDVWITITSIDWQRGLVRLGIEAPPEVVIRREEIHDLFKQSAPTFYKHRGEQS